MKKTPDIDFTSLVLGDDNVRSNIEYNRFEYYKDGYFHRVDGPAVVDLNREEEGWYRDGKLHRECGAANCWWYDGEKMLDYYLKNIQLTFLYKDLV